MLEEIGNLPDHVLGVRATGEVTEEDLKLILLPGLEKLVEKHGHIHYILILDTDVKQFTAGAWIQDLIAGIKHFTQWKRIAIVSDQKAVEKFTNIFSAAVPGKAKGFSLKEQEEAITWVSLESDLEQSTIEKADTDDTAQNFIAGFVGALVLTILHEYIRKRYKDIPRIDQLGKQAVSKSAKFFRLSPPTGKKLHKTTLVGDLISNTLYYSLIGWGGNKGLAAKALGSGLAAGIGAVKAPKHLKLDNAPVASSRKKAMLTIAYYLTGAIVTGIVLKWIKKR